VRRLGDEERKFLKELLQHCTDALRSRRRRARTISSPVRRLIDLCNYYAGREIETLSCLLLSQAPFVLRYGRFGQPHFLRVLQMVAVESVPPQEDRREHERAGMRTSRDAYSAP
jgi:hypothetical protein